MMPPFTFAAMLFSLILRYDYSYMLLMLLIVYHYCLHFAAAAALPLCYAAAITSYATIDDYFFVAIFHAAFSLPSCRCC